jgi:hypothetical protein
MNVSDEVLGRRRDVTKQGQIRLYGCEHNLAFQFKPYVYEYIDIYLEKSMPRTPIFPELLHEPGNVTEDARKIEIMSDAATQIAYEYARKVLRSETAAGAAQIVVEDAASLLSGLLEDPSLPKAEIEEMRQELGANLARGMSPPEEEEVFKHAQALSSAVMAAWLQVMLDKQSGGRHLTSSDILPDGADGPDKQWMDVWRSALPYGLEGNDAFSMLRKIIASLVDDPRLVEDRFLDLPGGLRLKRSEVEDAIREKVFA